MTITRDGGEVFSILSLGNYKYLLTIAKDGDVFYFLFLSMLRMTKYYAWTFTNFNGELQREDKFLNLNIMSKPG